MLKELIQKNLGTLISLMLLVVVPVVVSSVLGLFLINYQHSLESFSITEAILYFVVVSFTMAFALTPTTFIAMVTGFLFGWIGFPGIVVAYGVASMVGYTVAQMLDHGKLLSFLYRFDKAAAVMEELRDQSWSLIFLTRISPVLPFAFMTFVLSLMRVNKRKFLLASLVGMLPRTLFFFWVGTQAQNLIKLIQDPDTGSTGKILVIALILISGFGLYYIFDKALKKALRRKPSKKN